MMKKWNKKYWLCTALTCVIILTIWIVQNNVKLEITEYHVASSEIPEVFDGFRIVQVSDLHNAEFGEGNSKLVELLSQTDADIIVITGDLIDSRHTAIEIALDFCNKAMEIAPVYYVTGNHEARVAEYVDLKVGMVKAGVKILENEQVQIEREGESITLMGIQDPSFSTDYLNGDSESVASDALRSLQHVSDRYTVLLSHRPEIFDVYVEFGINLVFSGHAHGGQFRLPFIGGLVAPNQGFFPEFDAGLFEKENTTMIVSRGIGNSIIPVRINNCPEITICNLVHREGSR